VSKQIRKRRGLSLSRRLFSRQLQRGKLLAVHTIVPKPRKLSHTAMCRYFRASPIDRNEDEALAEQLYHPGRPTFANDHRAKAKHSRTSTRGQRLLAHAEPGSVAVGEAGEEWREPARQRLAVLQQVWPRAFCQWPQAPKEGQERVHPNRTWRTERQKQRQDRAARPSLLRSDSEG